MFLVVYLLFFSFFIVRSLFAWSVFNFNISFGLLVVISMLYASRLLLTKNPIVGAEIGMISILLLIVHSVAGYLSTIPTAYWLYNTQLLSFSAFFIWPGIQTYLSSPLLTWLLTPIIPLAGSLVLMYLLRKEQVVRMESKISKIFLWFLLVISGIDILNKFFKFDALDFRIGISDFYSVFTPITLLFLLINYIWILSIVIIVLYFWLFLYKKTQPERASWLGFILIILSWLIQAYQNIFLVALEYKEPLDFISDLLARFYTAPVALISGSALSIFYFIKNRAFISKFKMILGPTLILIIVLPLITFYAYGFLLTGRFSTFLYAPGNRPDLDWEAEQVLISFKDDSTWSDVESIEKQVQLIEPAVKIAGRLFDGPEWIVNSDFIKQMGKSTLEQSTGRLISRICADRSLITKIESLRQDDACKFLSQGQYLRGIPKPVFIVHLKGNSTIAKAEFLKNYSEFSELPKSFLPEYFPASSAPNILAVVQGHKEEIRILQELQRQNPDIEKITYNNEWIRQADPYSWVSAFFIRFNAYKSPMDAKNELLNIKGIEEIELELRVRLLLITFEVPKGQEEKWIKYFKNKPTVESASHNVILQLF